MIIVRYSYVKNEFKTSYKIQKVQKIAKKCKFTENSPTHSPLTTNWAALT